jgi:hypothetical protein
MSFLVCPDVGYNTPELVEVVLHQLGAIVAASGLKERK